MIVVTLRPKPLSPDCCYNPILVDCSYTGLFVLTPGYYSAHKTLSHICRFSAAANISIIQLTVVLQLLSCLCCSYSAALCLQIHAHPDLHLCRLTIHGPSWQQWLRPVGAPHPMHAINYSRLHSPSGQSTTATASPGM